MSIVPTIASPTFNVYCKSFVFSNTIVAPRPCTSSSNAISFSSLYVGLSSLPFKLIETCAEPRSTLSHLETIAMFTEVPFFVLPRIVSWFFNTIALRPGFSEVATSVYSTLVGNTSLIAEIASAFAFSAALAVSASNCKLFCNCVSLTVLALVSSVNSSFVANLSSASCI